jgi:protein-ribulosamine 3-kinase
MTPEVRSAVEDALGAPIGRARPVSGGDINEAFAVVLRDGRSAFIKTNQAAPPSMFPAEARGLSWLAAAQALRIPHVLAVSPDRSETPAFLALEYLEPGPPGPGFDEAFGRGLASLHRAGAPCFGLDHDNFIGRLPQSNTSAATWAAFYRDRRLGAQLALAERTGRATQRMRVGFEKLFARLDDLVGAEEPPSRLHGDLWGGNLHVSSTGEPCLVDPAVYGGHREIDLAMMRLFGGFSTRTFSAYAECHPLAAGHEDRVALYQLYPLMVHVNLFGGSYGASVERALGRYV